MTVKDIEDSEFSEIHMSRDPENFVIVDSARTPDSGDTPVITTSDMSPVMTSAGMPPPLEEPDPPVVISGADVDGFGPLGHFKHGIYSCFDVFFSSLMCLAFCCTPCVFGQLMTRLGLNCTGSPRNGDPSACVAVFLFTTAAWISWFAFSAGGYLFILYVVFVVLATRTRAEVRRRFHIPPSVYQERFGILDDCFFASCCGCCSAIQLVRHTHDEQRYPYSLCSTDGLPSYAPALPLVMEGREGGTPSTPAPYDTTSQMELEMAQNPIV